MIQMLVDAGSVSYTAPPESVAREPARWSPRAVLRDARDRERAVRGRRALDLDVLDAAGAEDRHLPTRRWSGSDTAV
jgi:hypothetical protein